MKQKMNQMEILNRELMLKSDTGSKFNEIKVLFGRDKYIETDSDVYALGLNCLIYHVSIKPKDNSELKMNKYIEQVWNDQQMLDELIQSQPIIHVAFIEEFPDSKLIIISYCIEILIA